MNFRTVKVVLGSHKQTPSAPKQAQTAGLRNRIAIVLDSYRPDKVDAYFDSELFLVCARVVLDALSPDQLQITSSPGGAVLSSLSDLEALWSACSELEQEPPALILAYREGELLCVAVPELWVNVGGPDPYHDSYTMSFYMSAPEGQPLASRVSESVRGIGAEPTVIRAAA